METKPSEIISPDTVVHRIGGSNVVNLRLKAKEETLNPPGISVFLGGTASEATEQMRVAFPHATRLLQKAKRVGTATVEEIRRAGFDVISQPTRHFANHARLPHPDGLTGFADVKLTLLSQAFQDTIRSE